MVTSWELGSRTLDGRKVVGMGAFSPVGSPVVSGGAACSHPPHVTPIFDSHSHSDKQGREGGREGEGEGGGFDGGGAFNFCP